MTDLEFYLNGYKVYSNRFLQPARALDSVWRLLSVSFYNIRAPFEWSQMLNVEPFFRLFYRLMDLLKSKQSDQSNYERRIELIRNSMIVRHMLSDSIIPEQLLVFVCL